MNATDILGEILRGGKGGGILKDVLGGGRGRGRPAPRQQTEVAAPPSSKELERDARDLEDLLGVDEPGAPSRTRRQPSRPTRWDQPAPERFPAPMPQRKAEAEIDPDREDDESLVLLRAMIHAVKADGRLSDDEQRALFDQVGSRSQDAVRFLQREFDRDTNVRDFAWSVPIGLEYKAYMVSLSAIDLDTKSESTYLRELAHGLRLPPEVTAQVHRRYGVAVLD